MTDEQFKQLMEKLEQILQRLPSGPTYVGTPAMQPLAPGQCYFCGGFHGGMSMCPKLQPTCISTTQGMGH